MCFHKKYGSILILFAIIISLLNFTSTIIAYKSEDDGNYVYGLGDFEVLGTFNDFDCGVRVTISVDPYPIVYYPEDIPIYAPYYASVRGLGLKYMTYGNFMSLETNFTRFCKYYNASVEKIASVNLEGEYYLLPEPDVNGWVTYGSILRSYWREILLNVTKLAIDAGADMVVYDGGWGNLPANEWSFDDETLIGFNNYLASKYNETELKMYFNISDISTFNFRDYLLSLGYSSDYLDPVKYENLPYGLNPPDNYTMNLWREFENYNLKVLMDFYRQLMSELKSYAHSKGREFYIAANLKPTLSYHDAEGRVSIIPLASVIDFPFFEIWYDDIEYPIRNVAPLFRTIYSSGKHFASMTSPTPGFSGYFETSNPYPDEPNLATAELIACGGWPQMGLFNHTYIKFIQEHPELLPKIQDGEYALIYSLPSALNYRALKGYLNNRRCLFYGYLPFEAIFYLLSDSHLSFDVIIFGDNEFYNYTPTLNDLLKYKAIFLPNVTCLSDSQVQLLLDYVKQGGVLIGFGVNGICNENGFPVNRPEFTNFFNATGYYEYIVYDYGDGKIVSIGPGIFEYISDRYALYWDYYHCTPPEERTYDFWIEMYFESIGKWIYLLNQTLNDANVTSSIKTDLNPFVMFIQYWDPNSNSMLFHFINYEYDLYDDIDSVIDQINVSFTFKLRPEFQGKPLEVRFYSPEFQDGIELEYTLISNDRIRVTIPRIHVWGILRVCEKTIGPKLLVVSEPMTINDTTLILSDHVLVESELSIINSTIIINSTLVEPLRIIINSNGSLIMRNSKVILLNENCSYYIKVYGGSKVFLENSVFMNCGFSGSLDTCGFHIESEEAIIIGCTFNSSNYYGLLLKSANYSYIENCSFINNNIGLAIYQSNYVKIVNCKFNSNNIGLYANHAHEIEILNSYFNNSMFGLMIDHSDFILIKDSIIKNSIWDGISAWTSIFIETVNCTLIDNGYGITIRNTPVSTIVNCDLINNTHCGILLRDINMWSVMPPRLPMGYNSRMNYLPIPLMGGWDGGARTIITHNNIIGSKIGVYSSCSGYFNEYLRIINNTFSLNNYGLILNDTNAIVIGNNFIDNDVQAICNLNVEFNCSSYGNYWSDYSGVGPYNVYNNYYDHYPLLNPNNTTDTLDINPPLIEILGKEVNLDGKYITLNVHIRDETSFYTDPSDNLHWINIIYPVGMEDGEYWALYGVFNMTKTYNIGLPEEPEFPNDLITGIYIDLAFLNSSLIEKVKYTIYTSDIYGNWGINDSIPPHITLIKYELINSNNLHVIAVIHDSSKISNATLIYIINETIIHSIPMNYNADKDYYEVMVSDLPSGTVKFYVLAKDVYNNTSTSNTFQVQTEAIEVSFTLCLKAGWNMISIPLKLENNSIANVFGELDFYSIYTWNSTTKRYVVPEKIEVGKGYWILVLSDVNITLKGLPVNYVEVSLDEGWNMIGSIINTASFTVTPENAVYHKVYDWNSISKRYNVCDCIEPGKGYWVLAYQKCIIKIQ